MIRITLRGQGGILDSRMVDYQNGVDPFENGQVNEAVIDLTSNCIFAVGDTITIEEMLA